MAQEGLKSLFPIEELSIIGFSAVVKQLPKVLRLIRQTVAAAVHAQPDMLVIIDSPDFTHRVARRVRSRDPVDPDRRLCLAIRLGLAAGPGARHGGLCRSRSGAAPVRAGGVPAAAWAAPCSYVGHPLIEQLGSLRPNAREQERRNGTPPVLLVLPGSRRGEIRHHMTVFGEALDLLQAQGKELKLILPTMPHLLELVREGVNSWKVAPQIVVGESEKRAAFRIATAALAKSGTVTLELALAQRTDGDGLSYRGDRGIDPSGARSPSRRSSSPTSSSARTWCRNSSRRTARRRSSRTPLVRSCPIRRCVSSR